MNISIKIASSAITTTFPLPYSAAAIIPRRPVFSISLSKTLFLLTSGHAEPDVQAIILDDSFDVTDHVP